MKSPIQPSVGRVVLVRTPTVGPIGVEAPAIVTNAQEGSDVINVMVLQDMGTPYPLGSVPYAQDNPEAASDLTTSAWRWMDYQLRNPDRGQASAEISTLERVGEASREQVITLKLDAASLIDAIPKIAQALDKATPAD